MTAPLDVGGEAWTILSEVAGDRSASGTRRTLVGAARVRVLELPGWIDFATGAERATYHVEILAASPTYLVGRKLELGRGDLYACADRAEHAAFGAEVRRFWGASSARVAWEAGVDPLVGGK